ncbi:baseplate tail tube cap [Aeromonas phage ZPAH1]|nr:baseplate tail tube cap [Aeromonas phage Aswh_1]QQG34062.1 baseplate tail tube cap [Aeromonas phage ZPAH1]
MKVSIVDASRAADGVLAGTGGVKTEGGTLILENKNTKQKGISALQYPLTLKGSDNRHSSYLVFYAVKPTTGGLSNNDITERSMRSVKGSFNEETLAVIQLYMPNMNENISHNYDSNDGGFIQDVLMNYRANASDQDGMMDKAGNAASATGKAALQKLAVEVGGLTQRFNSQVTGNVLGDRSAQMYKGTSVRQQNFLFQFRPRSLAELKEVGQIIKTFMVLSSAENRGAVSLADLGLDTQSQIASGEGYTSLEVPPLWFIEERVSQDQTQKIRYTPKFAMGPAGISNIRINKTPDQLYDTFSASAADSIAIDFELTVTELRPVYRDYWEELTKGLGTPDTGEFFFGSYGSGNGGKK